MEQKNWRKRLCKLSLESIEIHSGNPQQLESHQQLKTYSNTCFPHIQPPFLYIIFYFIQDFPASHPSGHFAGRHPSCHSCRSQSHAPRVWRCDRPRQWPRWSRSDGNLGKSWKNRGKNRGNHGHPGSINPGLVGGDPPVSHRHWKLSSFAWKHVTYPTPC